MLRVILIGGFLFGVSVTGQEYEPKAADSATKLTDTTKPSPAPATREAGLAKAVEKQEMRHFDLHKFYIPATQGNLQWLAATVGAKPEEVVLVWKLMRDWGAARWLQNATPASRNPS